MEFMAREGYKIGDTPVAVVAVPERADGHFRRMTQNGWELFSEIGFSEVDASHVRSVAKGDSRVMGNYVAARGNKGYQVYDGKAVIAGRRGAVALSGFIEEE